jgi:hypothetical protein
VIFNRGLKRKLAERDRRIAELERRTGGTVRPEDIVWIMGSPRTGSTWLGQMMATPEGAELWREPQFGLVLSLRNLITNREQRFASRYFLLGEPYREVWIRSMRNLFLDGVAARWPGFEGRLIVKDPNASMGAPLVMEAFPESRLVFVVRDPRDVVSSQLDASREGSWHAGKGFQASLFDSGEGDEVEQLARQYVINVGATKQAYDDHRGPKSLVRYEDLREDARGVLEQIHADLGLEIEGPQLAGAVDRHDWEAIPEEKKGEGKTRRKGQAGSWRDDLTPEQARTVERVTASLLREYYPEAPG